MNWNSSSMGADSTAGLHEARRGFREVDAQEGGAGCEHQVEAGGHEMLIATVEFAQAAFGAVALDGIADGSAGSNDAHASRTGGRTRWRGPPNKLKGAAVHAAALFADSAKINRALQALAGAQTHWSNDRQALATLLAAGGEDLAAATGGLAGAKTDLAGAFLAMRAECRLHRFMAKRGSDSREGRGGVKREVLETFWPETGWVQVPRRYFRGRGFECEQPA